MRLVFSHAAYAACSVEVEHESYTFTGQTCPLLHLLDLECLHTDSHQDSGMVHLSAVPGQPLPCSDDDDDAPRASGRNTLHTQLNPWPYGDIEQISMPPWSQP